MKARSSAPGSASFFLAALVVLWSTESGCELLRPSPFRVMAFRPSTEFVPEAEKEEVRITFNRKPDKTDAIRSFSLLRDGSSVYGTFSFEGDDIVFIPAEGFVRGSVYAATVTTEAEDETGISLDDTVAFTFKTKLSDSRPTVISTEPEEGDTINGKDATFHVRFSRPMDYRDTARGLSFEPDIDGFWTSDETRCVFSFTALAEIERGRRYDLVVSSDCRDTDRNALGKDVRVSFSNGIPGTVPELVSVAPSGNGVPGGYALTPDILDDGIISISEGFESDWGIELGFEGEVSVKDVLTNCALEPSVGFSVAMTDEFASRIILVFRERLEYGREYAFTVRKGIRGKDGGDTAETERFRFLVDGPRTSPPELVSLNIADSGGTGFAEFKVSEPFGTLSIGDDGEKFVDMYFRVAPGSEVDRFSIMEKISFSCTNSCASFSLRSVTGSGFLPPLPAEKPGLRLFRVTVQVENDVTRSGVVTVRVGAGLLDSSGNASSVPQSVVMLK